MIESLTPREWEIMERMINSETNKVITIDLGIDSTSAAPKMTANDVLSSWLTSVLNTRSRLRKSCNLALRSSIARARMPISSSDRTSKLLLEPKIIDIC